jgi:hypothetical protein
MGYSVIRYGVKNGSVEDNRGLVEKVFEALGRSAPTGLQYLVLELEDGEFIHLVNEEGDTSPLPRLAAFKSFTEHHGDRRATPISRKSASIVGNYRMLAGMQPE